GTAATVRIDRDRVASVTAGAEEWRAAAVISAVPWFSLSETIAGRPPALASTLDRARAMEASPIVTINLWCDRTVIAEPFVGLPGRTFQWVFDKRSAFRGEAADMSRPSCGASPTGNRPNDRLLTAPHPRPAGPLPP